MLQIFRGKEKTQQNKKRETKTKEIMQLWSGERITFANGKSSNDTVKRKSFVEADFTGVQEIHR